jgi:zinc protease
MIEPLGSAAQRSSTGGAQPAESEVIKKVLPNGLTLLVKRHAVQPLVTMQAFVKGGIIADTAKTSGRSSIATAMMTKGTEKYTAEQIANFFDSVGGAINVSSQRNSSYLTCAVLKDDFPTALDFCHQVLVKPTFPAEEFKKEQELQLTRIAARAANPQTEIIDFWTTQLPDTTPYSRTIEGRVETVGKLTPADCKQFHKEYFVPSNMVIAVFGDIDPEATVASLTAKFGAMPKSSFAFPEFPLSHVSKETQNAVLKNQQQGTSMVLLSYPSVSVLAEKERSELEVLNSVLTGGGGSGGRLFEELRGAKLVYYVFGIEVTGLAPGYFLFLAQTQPETADEVARRIQANIERVRKEGIPAAELALAKEKLIAANAQRNTTPGEQAFQAALNQLYGLGYDYDKGYDDRINRVTSDDVQALVAKFFNHPLIIQSQPVAAE